MRLADQTRGEPDQHLVLNERVAELHQHLPSGAPLAEILGSMGRGIEVELGMAPDERDHLVDPRPAPEAADDRQLGKVDGDLVEVPRMAEVVGPVGRVVHRRVDAYGDAELGGLGVERVEAAIAGRNAVHEGRDAEGLEALLTHALLQLADAAHAEKCADPGEADETIRVFAAQLGHLVVGGAEGHRAHDARFFHQLHVGGELGLRARVATALARAEDALVVGHAVAGRTLRGRGGRGRGRSLPGCALRNAALHVDHSHHVLPRLTTIGAAGPTASRSRDGATTR